MDRVNPPRRVYDGWADYLGQESVLPPLERCDHLAREQNRHQLSKIMDPFTSQEVGWALRAMSPSSSRGLDDVGVAELRRMRMEMLVDLKNFILRDLPEALLRARVTLIPKKSRSQTSDQLAFFQSL